MRVLIIEDEPFVAKDLENTLRKLEPGATILPVITSVQAAMKWFSGNTAPDLILSDGISFEIFEKLHVQCPIIFTTAYDEYAIRAFKLNSIDYLLKPIDAHELGAAMEKFKTFSHENVLAEQLKTMLDQWGKQPKYKERFIAQFKNALVPVQEHDIAYFHKEELIYLHTMANERYISEHHTLDEMEALVNPEKFFRVNRQFIIHIQSVGKIKTTHKGLTIQLKPPFNMEIDISREKATAFKKWVG